jgi:uncharacterized protein HemY
MARRITATAATGSPLLLLLLPEEGFLRGAAIRFGIAAKIQQSSLLLLYTFTISPYKSLINPGAILHPMETVLLIAEFIGGLVVLFVFGWLIGHLLHLSRHMK